MLRGVRESVQHAASAVTSISTAGATAVIVLAAAALIVALIALGVSMRGRRA